MIPTKDDLKHQLIERIRKGTGKRPCVKTRVIRSVSGKYWRYGGGYVSGWFITVASLTYTCMNELIDEGKVRYIARKPVELVEISE